MASTYAAPPLAPSTAGFLVRTVAYLVDAFLLSLVGGAFPYLVISNSGNHAGAAGGGSALISLIYFLIFWSNIGHGRTFGMRLFGLRVTRLAGTELGLGQALIRWIGLWISFVVCFIGVIWVAFDGRHQGWHDKIASTLVVRA